MGRIIKFRCWYDRVNAFVNVDDIGCNSLNDLKDNYHVMQFTGLIDKNDKEIYEGDIVSLKSREGNKSYTGVVSYDHVSFYVPGFFFSHYCDPYDMFSEESELIEIIGNIHENPELIINVV